MYGKCLLPVLAKACRSRDAAKSLRTLYNGEKGENMKMKDTNDFISSKIAKEQRKSNSLGFIPNKVSVLRKKQRLMKSQLEPDINEIQRFARRGL